MRKDFDGYALFMNAEDLVNLNLFPSEMAVYKSKQRKQLPFVKIDNKLRFPQNEIRAWVDSKKKPLAVDFRFYLLQFCQHLQKLTRQVAMTLKQPPSNIPQLSL